MKKTVVCLTVLLSLASLVAWSEAKSDLAEGIRYHDLSRVDPAGNLNKGKSLLGPLKDKDPVARGYYGSLLTIEADSQNKKKKVMKAMELLEEGTTFMDEAIESSPNTEDLRFLRMINCYELTASSPLNRYKVMKDDIDWLDANRSSLQTSGKGTLDLYKGLYFMKARKPDEGIAAFKSCIAVSPGSDEAKEAAKQLARYQ